MCFGVDVDELDRCHRTGQGWLSPDVVEALIERDRLDLLRREAAAGDFACADALGRRHLSQGEPDAALAVYRPFADSGWSVAVTRVADILAAQGMVDAAIAALRHLVGDNDFHVVQRLAELLVGQDRIDEAITLLASSRPATLVELTAGRDRDQEILAILHPRLTPSTHGLQRVVAKLLERMGRADEAVELLLSGLRHDETYHVNHAEQIADILARHDTARLAEFAAGDGKEYGVYRLARLFEEQGDLDAAVAALAPYATPDRRNESAVLADLLARHGRIDEAIEILRPATIRDPECLMVPLCVLLIGQGRPVEARAVADEIAAQFGDRAFDIRMQWIDALAECGRLEQAIAELRTDPDADTDYVRTRLAELLTETDGLAEAEALLTGADNHWDRARLALVLVRQGRPEEAIAAAHG